MKTLEAARRQAIAAGRHPVVAQLAKLRAIGPRGGLDTWIKELFGWRRFANRREIAGSLGLAPTPYDSGDSRVDQGMSKAGNKRARALLVELAWKVGQLPAGQHPDPVVPPALRGRRQAHAAGGHRGPGAAPRHRAVALPSSTARSRIAGAVAQANHRLIKAQRLS